MPPVRCSGGFGPLLLFPTPSFALQGVSRAPRAPAAADELCRQTQRLALRLVFKVPDEFLAKAESWIPGKHVGAKVRGNILGAPPRDVHGGRDFEEVTLGVLRDVHLVPHVSHDDLCGASA